MERTDDGREGATARWATWRAPTALWAVVVGGLWVVAYLVFRRVFPDDHLGQSAYRYRDDALITLSHARGLVEVDTISIGVSGARVEGFSSPLMFVLAWAYYALGGVRERLFLDAQVLVSTFALGVGVFAALRLAAPRRRRLVAAVVATAATVPVLSVYPVFGWHSSGMENALTNALVVVAVVALAGAVERDRGDVFAGTAVGLLSLTRTEFVAHAAPLLLAAVVAGRFRRRPWRRIAVLVAPAAIIWGGVTLARVLYFGSLTPNSGAAQAIAPGHDLVAWARVTWPVVVVGVLIAILAAANRIPAASLPRRPWCWAAACVTVVVVSVIARGADRRDALPHVRDLEAVARSLGLWWWLAAAGGLLVALLLRGRARVVHGLLAVAVLSGTAHVLVFGPARLAAERVASFVVVPTVVLVAACLLALDWSGLVAGTRSARVVLVGAALVCGVAAVGLWANRSDWNEEHYLCCDPTDLTPRILAVADDLRGRTGLPAPTVANPDIGLLTLGKEVNVTDLGHLGDPLLRSLWTRALPAGRVDREDVWIGYLNHYATPDVVEAHGAWTCQYAAWLTSPEFTGRYEKVWDDGWSGAYASSACPEATAVGGGIWVRGDLDTADGRAEVALARTLRRSPSAARVGRELERCRRLEDDVPWACQYVTRSVVRSLPAFAAAGLLDATRARFRGASARYDRAVLSARDDGDWYEPAVDFLLGEGARSRRSA